ncbi:MAG: PHP domain-containing protein [bacterium]
MFEYVGAIHIHSIFSDGSGEVKDIADAACEVGLDYIFLTDHNTLRALKEGYEGWYNNTLLLVGTEINDKENKNHYLAFGIDEVFSTRMPAKEYVTKVAEAGGIGFLAHPFEKRSSMEEHPPYPWTEWQIDNFTGIEIWNHMSEWMEGLTEENKYNSFIHPLSSIVGPTEEALAKWDELSRYRKVVGIGGVDAHAHKLNLLGFFEVEVFPYKVLFKSIRTHIITNTKIPTDPELLESAKHKLYNSLSMGRCFISNYYYGEAKGFRFFAEDGKKTYQMGDTILFKDKVKLRVLLPSDSCLIKLIHNGVKIAEVENIDAEFVVFNSGVYRIEVFRENKAWIFSNHIRIKK